MKRVVIPVLCCLAFAAQAEQAGQASQPGKAFFRWTDKAGKVHYGDHLPPEQSQTGGLKYDASGLNKQLIEGAKTPEQLEAESRLGRLRAEQNRLFAAQLDRDQALLRSFRSEEEIRLALQGNLNTLNTQLKVIQGNLQRQQEKLAPLQQQVDGLQKEGKPVPKGVADNLAAAQRQVATYQDQIAKIGAEQANLTENTERDVARFNALKSPTGSGRPTSESAQGNPQELLVGAVPCGSKAACDKAWDAARRYLQKFTADPLSVDTDRILRTMEPAAESEYAMAVVRIAEPAGDALFLDLRCTHSSIGKALCASDKSREVRQGFRKAVDAAAGLAGR